MEIIETNIYHCPNRRADRPVLENLIAFGEEELAAIGALNRESLIARMTESGLSTEYFSFDAGDAPEDPRVRFSTLYSETALSLQRSTGHRVQLSSYLLEADPLRCRVMFEYEDRHTAQRASRLALQILQDQCPALALEISEDDAGGSLHSRVSSFVDFSTSRALPRDTEAIIEAARRADIPVIKLDRDPFEPNDGVFRIRPNSPLKLGQGRHLHIVDSTFCIDRCDHLLPLLKDRERTMGYLREAGMPTPAIDLESRNCTTLGRARRSAERIGLPVAVKPIGRGLGSAVTAAVGDEQELARAHALAREFGSRIWIEKHIPGRTYKVLVANLQCLAILAISDKPAMAEDVTSLADPSLAQQAENLAGKLGVGVLVLTCVAPDISIPLERSGGAFVDMDLAPELDAFLEPASPLMERAAAEFVNWLFPGGSRSRIPLVTVTGTNGKTTTSRMIHAILIQSGHRPGLACTEGLYLDPGSTLAEGDMSGVLGHVQILGHEGVDSAVLETALGGVSKWGFGYDRCDVGVCLNVTADHLGHGGIDTIEDLAEMKRSIVARASDAIVLNADDPRCLAMLPFDAGQRICLASTEQSLDALRRSHGIYDCFAVLEQEAAGEQYLVLYDGLERIRICPVNGVPATFGGTAWFNVSNILHACAASYLMGCDPGGIRQAAGAFEMNWENTPGRLNVYDGLPFLFILDYAHNPDGIARFCDYIDKLKITGRKFVAFSAAGYNPDEIIRGNAIAIAGHFDYYYPCNYPGDADDHPEVPSTLRHALLECGVPADNIRVAGVGMDAIEQMVNSAGPGDLVAIMSGSSDRESIWQHVTGGAH